MFVYDLGTELSIEIIRTIHVISESKPALLTCCMLSSVACAVKCTFEMEKNYPRLYCVLLFYLRGKSTEAA